MKLRLILKENDQSSGAISDDDDHYDVSDDSDEVYGGGRVERIYDIAHDNDLDKFIDPDEFYEFGSITILYGDNGSLHYGKYPLTHTQMITDVEIQQEVFAGTMYESDIGEDHDGRWWYRRGEDVALYGRISRLQRYVSFWNTDSHQINEHLPTLIKILLKKELINGDTIVMAATLDEMVPASDIDPIQTNSMSDDEIEQIELKKQIHLARGDEKKALMQKAGLKVVPGKRSQMATVMQKIGKLSPGQKWWTTSESKDGND